jgi:hypothetical protein
MSNYTTLPIFEINKYIWDQLKTNQILDENKYYTDEFMDILIPIVPAQQIPEFNNLLPGQTYLIYDYEDKPNPEHWWISEQILTYSIVSPNYDTINQIMNMLKDIFRRYDDSAKDLNTWSGKSGYYNFHFIYVDSVISPQHFANEGGFMIGEVQLCVSYARNLDQSGRFS